MYSALMLAARLVCQDTATVWTTRTVTPSTCATARISCRTHSDPIDGTCPTCPNTQGARTCSWCAVTEMLHLFRSLRATINVVVCSMQVPLFCHHWASDDSVARVCIFVDHRCPRGIVVHWVTGAFSISQVPDSLPNENAPLEKSSFYTGFSESSRPSLYRASGGRLGCKFRKTRKKGTACDLDYSAY